MLTREIGWSNFIPDRDQYIIEQCRDKKVLHIGPTDWPYTQEKINKDQLLYKKIDEVCVEQLGVDMDKEGAEFLNGARWCERSRIVVHDLNKLADIDFKPEVIVFGETLEHLMNHEIALSSIKQCMDRNAVLIISVPNATYIGNFIYALFGAEYQHPDHSVAWSFKTLQQFLGKVGVDVDEIIMTHLPHQALNWKGKTMHYLTYPVTRIFPLFAPDVMVRASLGEADSASHHDSRS